jgi:hypothetical protein
MRESHEIGAAALEFSQRERSRTALAREFTKAATDILLRERAAIAVDPGVWSALRISLQLRTGR